MVEQGAVSCTMSVKIVLCTVLTLSVLSLKRIHCADILVVFPMQFKSHYFTLQPLLTGLANKGHNITAYTTLPFGPHPNITDILFEYKLADSLKNTDVASIGSVANVLCEIHSWGYKSAENFVKTKEFKQLISTDHKYDAIITFSVTVQEYLAALQHKFNTINIEIIPHANSASSCYFSSIPFNPSYYIDLKLPYTDRMNFFERLHNTYAYLVSILITHFVNIRRMSYIADEHIRYPGWESRPSLQQLISNKSLVFINGHHSVNYPYPLPPHVIDIAGINIKPNQPLPKDIEEFINFWPDGIVVLSWGSIEGGLKIYNDEVDIVLLTAFARLKYGVLWKTNKDTFSMPLPSNVMAVKWLPQQDVLANNKTKVFITHGGFNSVVETVYYGVPVVVTPFFLDQWKNGRKLVDVGMGVLLEHEKLTSDSLVRAVNQIADTKSYKEAALKRSAMFRDRPMKPLQEALYWIEYVMRYGDVLRPASTNLPFYKLFLFDILAITIFIISIIYFMIKKVISFNYKRLQCFKLRLLNKKMQ